MSPFSHGSPVLVIAELSANHRQSRTLAERTIRAIAETGADAVKLQTYTPDTITLDCDDAPFQTKENGLWSGRNLHSLYTEAFTPWEWQPGLKRLAESLGLACFSSPFDPSAVDFLEAMDVPAYKIASFEITDIPLIEHCAAKGKPIILSTGIATLADIEAAVDACRRVGNDDIALLKCTSSYPAPVERANLATIPHLAATFGVVAGLSDHTLGIAVPIAAVALGARVIEKHFTLDRSAGGVDAAFSLEPDEFRQMVEGIRVAERAIGRVDYSMTTEKAKSRRYRRSLFVVEDVKAGEELSSRNVRSIRPGDGLPPVRFAELEGRRFVADVSRGTPLSAELLGPSTRT